MADDQKDERTEDPSEKKRREFREKGQVAQSREVNTAMLFTGGLIVWSFYAPFFWENLSSLSAYFWEICSEFTLTTESIQQMLLFTLQKMAVLLLPLFLSCLLLGFLSSFLQIGWLFTAKPLMPDFSKLDPITGLGRMISKRSLFEVVKSLGKISLVGLVAYWTLLNRFDHFLALAGAEIGVVLFSMSDFMFTILSNCCLVLIVIALIDYLFSRQEMEKKMRMTKQEIKEEHKEAEGDPLVKQKVRAIQRAMARKRMMADVPKADVIITNPTHYAVAIQYRRTEMAAPVVVAKGIDFVAMRIREIGLEHKVPLVENPVVARALYHVELGAPIPEEMFKAVAEILAYVYSLKKRG